MIFLATDNPKNEQSQNFSRFFVITFFRSILTNSCRQTPLHSPPHSLNWTTSTFALFGHTNKNNRRKKHDFGVSFGLGDLFPRATQTETNFTQEYNLSNKHLIFFVLFSISQENKDRQSSKILLEISAAKYIHSLESMIGIVFVSIFVYLQVLWCVFMFADPKICICWSSSDHIMHFSHQPESGGLGPIYQHEMKISLCVFVSWLYVSLNVFEVPPKCICSQFYVTLSK